MAAPQQLFLGGCMRWGQLLDKLMPKRQQFYAILLLDPKHIGDTIQRIWSLLSMI